MRILAVADTELPYLYEYYNPQRTKDVDLIVSCGDLKAKYLEFLTTVVNQPLIYVRGNHDSHYQAEPPEGCICIEDKVFVYKGFRFFGLGGSRRYNNSRYMYTERVMERRIRRARRRLEVYEGIDILVTHAPASGYGDLEDLPHRGFECFNTFLDRYKPAYMLHGHVHKEYGSDFVVRRTHESGTEIINCYGCQIIDIPDDLVKEPSLQTRRRIRRLTFFEKLKGES